MELDSDGEGKNEGISAMNVIEEVAALKGAQVRCACIQYVYNMLGMLKP